MNDEGKPIRQLSRRRFTGGMMLGGAVLAAGPLAAACAGDDDDAPEGTNTNIASATPTAGSSIEEFVVANEAEPADMLPYFGSYSQSLVTRNIYQTLVEPRMVLRDDGSVDVTYEPVLAASYERVEPTRWRFTLREGVTFHNGEEWNAEAARVSFAYMTDADLAGSFNKPVIL